MSQVVLLLIRRPWRCRAQARAGGHSMQACSFIYHKFWKNSKPSCEIRAKRHWCI